MGIRPEGDEALVRNTMMKEKTAREVEESQWRPLRGFHITFRDCEKYGFTPDCSGCQFHQGIVKVHGGHSTECRERMYQNRMAETTDQRRVVSTGAESSSRRDEKTRTNTNAEAPTATMTPEERETITVVISYATYGLGQLTHALMYSVVQELADRCMLLYHV